ncbi:H-NS family nucleoid-associated regulatory protein [Rhodoplanes roseus]|uniref:DNA-binding protein H-NS-like C-terminal domain-containing protein n=1 Tax=Rhodoplanes roseus TaxID=29409 RepID=A0A327KYW9_9BRAD|nr:H-NS histone family protein [Rhodoplanes roseus]RAI42805.1 hypothetical protein CH341_17580 [Rhodoplanes roseus]
MLARTDTTDTPGNFPVELTGARNLLAQLDDADLITMRAEIDRMIAARAAELRRQLAALGKAGSAARSPRAGRKVPPKYRGPNGETWAGRGAQPKWLAQLIAQGRTADEFRISEG